MEEILHQLIGSLSHYFQGFRHPRWVQDFFHQQYVLYGTSGSSIDMRNDAILEGHFSKGTAPLITKHLTLAEGSTS